VHSKSTAITKCHSGAIFEVEATDNMKYSVYPTFLCCTHKKSNLTVSYALSIYRKLRTQELHSCRLYTASSGISYQDNLSIPSLGFKNPKGFGFFNPEAGTERLCQNVGKKLPLVTA
jgi:hypothetical protein